MILNLLPNPALDKTVVVEGFETGKIHRPGEVLILAGGKGFNFARSLKNLGVDSLVVAPLGGLLGNYLLELAKTDSLACDPQPVKAELRTCLTIIDPAAQYRLTELYEKGKPLEETEWANLISRTISHFPEAQFLTISGSFPPGVPESGLVALLQEANRINLLVLIDSYGAQVKRVFNLAPALLKINQHEAAELTGLRVNNPSEAIQAARKLQRQGIAQVVITLGKFGAMGLTAQGESFSWASPPVTPVVSAVGSGDALFAGIAMGLAKGWSLPEALRWGVAAGAANTLQIGAGRFELQQVEQLLPSNPIEGA
ncbi:MAG: hexose kinase [Chloroflexi bacterium]|uniref:Hexose kinase n=1 Tax=Candidatus Chlorohelix allophototropha TaxID=3003348 RepID=A0A8T7M229_9CHLR|nr:hexose kinase [Chloroflexota bacterium]WJW66180.1 hexose kinase [Chloroflexota bacterium L227-S17]